MNSKTNLLLDLEKEELKCDFFKRGRNREHSENNSGLTLVHWLTWL